MKIYSFILSTILLSSFTGFGQNKSKSLEDFNNQIKDLKRTKQCQANYDKLGNTTKVLCRVNKEFLFDTLISFRFEGEKLTKSINRFELSFLFPSKELRFANERGLTINTGTETMILGEGERATKAVSAASKEVDLIEQIFFKVDRVTLAKLANADDLKFKLGKFENTMPDKAKILFQTILDLASLDEPSKSK